MLRSLRQSPVTGALSALVILLCHLALPVQGDTDNPILCPHPLPPPGLLDWPSTERPLSSFETLDQLCAFKNFGDSVGCWCLTLSGPRECFRPIADVVLWTYRPLRDYCKQWCRCPLEGVGEHDMTKILYPESEGSYDPERDRDLSSPDQWRGKLQGSSSGTGSGKIQASPLSGTYGSLSMKWAGNELLSTRPRSCRKSCKNHRCASHGRGCRCLANPEPVNNGIFLLYGCGVPPKLLPKKKRRSLDLDSEAEDARGGHIEGGWPCPCNGTYVSHACCDADNGLVWEDGDKWLGRLDESEL
jgi:hypothetical protein